MPGVIRPTPYPISKIIGRSDRLGETMCGSQHTRGLGGVEYVHIFRYNTDACSRGPSRALER